MHQCWVLASDTEGRTEGRNTLVPLICLQTGVLDYFVINTDSMLILRKLVFVKNTSVDPEVSVIILKHPAHRFDDARRPDVILPAGWSATRKDYLYRSVRPYVRPRTIPAQLQQPSKNESYCLVQ